METSLLPCAWSTLETMVSILPDGGCFVAVLIEERHSAKANEELREEAQALLRTVLKKNDEEDGRKVS